MEEVCPCSICRDVRPDSYVVPCEHTFCLRCILQWTLRKFTCPLCRSVMSAIHFSARADGSLPCVITLPSEYEAESHQRASLWGTSTSRPAPSGSPTHPTEEELLGGSHTAPGDLAARPTTPVPRDTQEPLGQAEQRAAAGPSAQGCSHSPTNAERDSDSSAQEMDDLHGQQEHEAAAGPSAQHCSHSPTNAERGRDRTARGSRRPRKRRACSARGTSQPCKRPPPRHH